MPSEYRGYRDHADHYYSSREFYAHPTDEKAGAFPNRTFNVLRDVSRQINYPRTDTQIKTQIWNFGGSLIQVNPKTGALNYKK